MIPVGQTASGEVALRKKIHDLLRQHNYRNYRVAEISQITGAPAKRVSATLISMMYDEKVAANYPHIHRVDRGLFNYDPQRPQVFKQRSKKTKTTKKPMAQPVIQQLSAAFTEQSDMIVLRHKSGKLYIARPVN